MRLLFLLHCCVVVFAGESSWGEWGEWSSCGASCGQGVRRRTRTCQHATGPGAQWCEGPPLQRRPCDQQPPCPVDGAWGSWSAWSVCSVSCGQGAMHRFRACSSPAVGPGGRPCQGSPREMQECFAIKECPRDGRWSSWSQWSQCSVTCGSDGSVFRYRSCNNPAPVAGGKPCAGPKQDQRPCTAEFPCPVNGQWSEWSEWSECSTTCGKGERSRERKCDHPEPMHGGLDCNRTDAGELQIKSCDGLVTNCPVDGGWSGWGEWGDCDSPDCQATSNVSYSFRQRSCDHPRPRHGGAMCQGTFLQAGLCLQPTNCGVDGGWGEWSAWTCTEFVAKRNRLCDSPPPSNGGKQCKGKNVQFHKKGDALYKEACPNFQPDDEDLSAGSGSGMPEENVKDYDEDYDD